MSDEGAGPVATVAAASATGARVGRWRGAGMPQSRGFRPEGFDEAGILVE